MLIDLTLRALKKLKKTTVTWVATLTAAGSWLMSNFSIGGSFGLQPSLCVHEFYQHAAPELINPKLAKNSVPMCFQGFSLNYSGVSKTPIWVAEHLTPQRLSTKIAREDHFHEETRLPLKLRSQLADYRGSGYDRGHMAPNGDMSDKASQFDSFSLANISPQTPENNQNTWREIEESLRSMVKKYKTDAYVVTGPIYAQQKVKTIKVGHSVLVPSHFYKAVYFPQIGMASAYLSANDRSMSAKVISICELEEKTGINIFPRLEENQKRQVFALPMQAKAVNAKQRPENRKTDLLSQCAQVPTEAQIKATQQLFVVNNSVSDQNLGQINRTGSQNETIHSLGFKLLEWWTQHGKK